MRKKIIRADAGSETAPDRRTLIRVVERALVAARWAAQLRPDDESAAPLALILDTVLSAYQRSDREGLAALEATARKVNAQHADLPPIVERVAGRDGKPVDRVLRAQPDPIDRVPSNRARPTALENVADGMSWALATFDGWPAAVLSKENDADVAEMAGGLARTFLALAAKTEPIATDLKRKGHIAVSADARQREGHAFGRVRNTYADELTRDPDADAERLVVAGYMALTGDKKKAHHLFDYRSKALKPSPKKK